MSEPFLGEIRIFSFNFAPRGWAFCNGQVLPIFQNQALFSLLGTRFGGNGQTEFALPDYRDRVPIHVAPGYQLGQSGGEQQHVLTINELPTHTHALNASNTSGTQPVPVGALLSRSGTQLYAPPATLGAMQPASVTSVGASQPHLNMQPFLALSFCIALQGIFPSRN